MGQMMVYFLDYPLIMRKENGDPIQERFPGLVAAPAGLLMILGGSSYPG